MWTEHFGVCQRQTARHHFVEAYEVSECVQIVNFVAFTRRRLSQQPNNSIIQSAQLNTCSAKQEERRGEKVPPNTLGPGGSTSRRGDSHRGGSEVATLSHDIVENASSVLRGCFYVSAPPLKRAVETFHNEAFCVLETNPEAKFAATSLRGRSRKHIQTANYCLRKIYSKAARHLSRERNTTIGRKESKKPKPA